MSARRAVHYVFLPATLAISLITFTHCLNAQQCQVAHDKDALKALQERAAAGDADAQCGLGKQYEHAVGVPQDNTQAVLWLQKSAEQGNIPAQVELGIVYDNMQDYAQALIWYRKAAEQGNPRAEYNLVSVIRTANQYRKMWRKPLSGFARQPIKATLSLRAIWVQCTKTA